MTVQELDKLLISLDKLLISLGYKEASIGKFVSVTLEGIDYHLEINDLADLEKITVSLARDLEKSIIEHDKLAQRLNNPQFVEKAKPEIVERDREQLQQLADKIEKLKQRQILFG